MIYCVEDDAGSRELMLYTLRSVGFEAEGFPDAEEFRKALKSGELPDLVILDIMMPGEDGISVLKRLRALPETADIPVIMETAKGTEYDKVTGLDLGADDYLVKPFGMMEMVSRVKAVLRRSGRQRMPDGPEELRMGAVVMNTEAHTVRVEEKSVELTLKEFELLRLFMKHPGKVFTREVLLDLIWDEQYAGETRTVDVHIGTLRSKLGRSGSMIRTVRGVGYRMEELSETKDDG